MVVVVRFCGCELCDRIVTMKIRRYKKLKKSMNFYIYNFKFREPYQILVDGNFCYAALNNKINIAADIPRYLQGEIKLLTTQCTIIEMENLGKKVGGALLILKQYALHKCGHEGKPIPAARCLLSMLGTNNEKHYLVATQDRDLQEKVRKIPGVPLLYLHLKTPVLEHPSDASLQHINTRLSGLSELQRKSIDKLKSDLKLNSDDNSIKKPRKKKKKGPNPLSCQKKKKPSGVQDKPIQKKEGEKKVRKKVRIPKHVREELFLKENK